MTGSKQERNTDRQRDHIIGQRMAWQQARRGAQRPHGGNGNESNGEETEKIKCGTAWQASNRKGGWHNESAGEPNGGLCKHGNERDKNCSNQTADPQVRHKCVRIYGTQLQLGKSEFIDESSIMVSRRRKRDTLRFSSPARPNQPAVQAQIPTICKETIDRSTRVGQMVLLALLM